MMTTFSRLFSRMRTAALAMAGYGLVSTANSAMAAAGDTLGHVLLSTGHQFSSLLLPISDGAYLVGTTLGIQSILALYRYAQKPGDPKLSGVLYRMFGSAAFLSLPVFLGNARNTLFGTNASTFTTQWATLTAGASGDGLDFALMNMVADIQPAVVALVGLVGFLSGTFMIGSALLAMATINYGQEQISKAAIITRFGIGTALVSMVSSVNSILGTVFGSSTGNATATTLAYDKTALDAASIAHIDAVMAAIFTWLAMIGLIAILRGMWVLKGSIEGNKGLTAPLTHLIAGAALVNCGEAVPIIQKTLGIV